ncbi:MAG: hypothetical protein FWH48_12410, partial [Oscillospiraceae bacterium]|nr:hypothetical protein [Oscillospiraceae bacterium]
MDNFSSLKENKINAAQSRRLGTKAAVVIALVFFVLFSLNMAMEGFIEAERAAQREKLEKEDWDQANAYYPMTDHYDGQFQEIYEKRVNADYIFIGTSHTTHGVTPEEFEVSGKKFFNFALNGSNPSYYVWWYNDVFKANRYKKPKAILFGVDWFMFDTNWLWRRPEFDYPYLRPVSRTADNSGGEQGDEYYEDGSDSSTFRYTGKWYDIDDLMTYITNRFALFSSRSRFIELILPEKAEEPEQENTGADESKDKERPYYKTPDGFVLSEFYKGYVPWESDFGGGSVGETTCRTRSLETEKAAFISLLDQFEAEDIPVVFYMAP